MSSLRHDERGEFSLMGMLMAMTLMLVVLGATLSVFSTAERVNRDSNDRSELQDRVRSGLDQMVAQLRNLASPTPDQPRAVDSAGPYDLVFQTVDRVGPNTGLNATNVMRVRYCLGTTNPTRVYRQEQRWTSQTTPGVPSLTGCPAVASSTGWSSTKVIATSVVNTRNGQNRPIFVYNAPAVADISSVHAQLYVDGDPGHGAAESTLSSGVFLRNQNRRPVAAFTADGTTVRGKIVLNGALSSDPEGDPLTYVWYDGTTKVGEGIRLDYTVTPGTSHVIQLKVYDLANLDGTSAAQTIAVPA